MQFASSSPRYLNYAIIIFKNDWRQSLYFSHVALAYAHRTTYSDIVGNKILHLKAKFVLSLKLIFIFILDKYSELAKFTQASQFTIASGQLFVVKVSK